ncbi:RNA-directed DNA polymerase, eukaryota, reverse transcriptase zinc-binding domain protein [Tanacetum coccineum]
MRPKRVVKPTQIFDNSSSIASNNKNKQKNSTKNNKNNVEPENIIVEDDDNREREIRTDKEVSNGSMRSEEEDSVGEKQCNAQEECKDQDLNNLNERGENGVEDEVLSREQNDVVSGEANSSSIGNDSCTPANSNTDNVINTHSEKFAKESNKSTSIDNDKHASYAQTVTKSLIDDGNKLFTIPTSVNSKCEELVLFDKELVREGYGLKDIVVDADEMCFFKFKDEDGMKYIIDQSPWIVNGKPLIVQKWDSEVVIKKETPCKIPVWIRLYNVPIEAWSIKGISAISSRVLVEVDAGKEYLEKIEINYVDAMKKVNQEASVKGNKDSEGFVEIINRKNKHRVKVGMNNRVQGNKQGYRGNVMNIQHRYVVKQKVPEPNNMEGEIGASKKMRKSANKYVVLSEERNDEEFEGNVCHDDRLIVDRLILMKSKPPPKEMLKWTYDMKLYFKYRWDTVNKEDVSSDEEDIIEEFNAASDLVADEIGGDDSQLLN